MSTTTSSYPDLSSSPFYFSLPTAQSTPSNSTVLTGTTPSSAYTFYTFTDYSSQSQSESQDVYAPSLRSTMDPYFVEPVDKIRGGPMPTPVARTRPEPENQRYESLFGYAADLPSPSPTATATATPTTTDPRLTIEVVLERPTTSRGRTRTPSRNGSPKNGAVARALSRVGLEETRWWPIDRIESLIELSNIDTYEPLHKTLIRGRLQYSLWKLLKLRQREMRGKMERQGTGKRGSSRSGSGAGVSTP